ACPSAACPSAACPSAACPSAAAYIKFISTALNICQVKWSPSATALVNKCIPSALNIAALIPSSGIMTSNPKTGNFKV
ncbi:hypothetical protein A2U01_0096298, partial [Trifolium medium]|nr:hypothetical protein [Trifolium medium]